MGKQKSSPLPARWSGIDRPLTPVRRRDRSRSQSSHASGTSHGSSRSSRSRTSQGSSFSRASRSSRRSSVSGRSLSTRTRRWLNVKRAGFGEGFATGFDMLSKEEQTKRSARRKRFGVTEVANRLPVQKLGKVDMLEQMRWPKGDEELRRDILHVYGVDLLDTDDIRTIFFGYGVKWVEWINDSSCNVAFEDDFTVKRILKFMNDESTILKKGSDGEDEDGKESKGEDTEMKDEDDVVDDGRKQGVDENEESASVVNKGSIGTAVTKEWSSMTCGDLSPSNSAGSELVPRGSIHSDFSPSENSALLSPAVSAAVSSGTASAPTGVAQGRFEHVFPLDEALEWKQIVPTRVRGEFYQFYMRMATSVDERPARPNPESKWSVNVLAAQRGKRDTGLLAKALKQSSRMRSSS